MTVPGYTDIGKGAKELLFGGKIGLYQFDKVLTVNAKTPQKVAVTLKAVEKNGALSTTLKMTKKTGIYNVELVPSQPSATLSVEQPLGDSGAKVTLSGSLPRLESTSKATVDYTHPYCTAKAACSLSPKPVLDVSAVVGYNCFLLGGLASLDVTNQQLKKWTAAASYSTPEAVASAHLSDALDTVRLTYWHKVDAASTVGAEVIHGRTKGDVKMALGYAHTNANGDLSKVKLGNDGIVQGLYEFKVRPDLTMATSVSVCTKDLQAAPRVGFAIDHSP